MMNAATMPSREVVQVDAFPDADGQIAVVDREDGPTPRAEMRWFTVQCGYGSWNACTAIVEAPSVAKACDLAIEAVNSSDAWRPLDHCGPTYVDAMAEGRDVDVWTSAGSKIEVPSQFAEHGETVMLKAALARLLEWADQMGGWDAPCWDEVRALLEPPGGQGR